MKAYFFSGLGADKRIFQKTVLPLGYEAVFIAWILPKVKETLKDYCLRIAAQISFNKLCEKLIIPTIKKIASVYTFFIK